MTAAISSTMGINECLVKAYAQITFSLLDSEICMKRGVVFFDDIRKKSVSSFPGFDNICSSLSNSFREGKIEHIKKLLFIFFFVFLVKDILYDSALVEYYCIELADHIYKENAEYISHAYANNEIPFIIAVKKRISAYSGLHRIFRTLHEIFIDLYKSVNKEQVHSSVRLVRQCIRLIHDQYGEDISLSSTAKQLFISPNYLSRIFSAEIGKTFSRYLLEYRITIAKKLLKESNDKVYEISYRVGYDDIVHFSKIFKQTTGLSPNQYRNQK
jgi:YesN/AraC family two-component response regulator